MNTYRCPTDSEPVLIGSPGHITGCGRTVTAEPDFEDLVDCPHCGIWFESAQGAQRARRAFQGGRPEEGPVTTTGAVMSERAGDKQNDKGDLL